MLRYKKLFAFFVGVSVIYILQIVLRQPDPVALARYHVTEAQLILITLTVALPYVVIWFIALSGYTRLKDYTSKIRRSKDGKAFGVIAKGVLLFTIWLPVSTLTSNLVTEGQLQHAHWLEYAVWLNLYTNLVIISASFYYVWTGSKLLTRLLRQAAYTRRQLASGGLFIAALVLYTFILFHDPARQFPADGLPRATYYLPDWMMVSTVMIPRMIAWTMGFVAVLNIYVYRRNTKGYLYKQALNNLAIGLAFVVLNIIGLGYFESSTVFVAHASLQLILIVVYVILIVMSIGYVYIARGAGNLQRIEEL